MLFSAGSISRSRSLPWSLYDHARLQAAFSRSSSIPPSPPVDMILSVQNEYTEASPNDPTGRPLYVAPCACAQSSLTFSFWALQRAMISSLSHGQHNSDTRLGGKAGV